MRPLPELPFWHDPELAPEGALIFDNSTIEKLKCPRLLELSWLRKRELVASKAGRNFGSTLHRGWEKRLHLCGNGPVTEAATLEINSAMQSWLAEHPQPMSDFRNFAHACRVMEAYNRHYGAEPWKLVPNPSNGKPIIEHTFCLPFAKVQGIWIFYAGKIDTCIEDSDGLWSFDHKTAFMFGETFLAAMQRDGGQLGYCWALEETLKQPVNGYKIDAVRIRRPARGDEYDGRAPVDASDFQRLPFAFDIAKVFPLWKRDVTAHIETILNMHRSGHFPEARWSCTNKFGKCDFFELCALPYEQRDAVLYGTTLFAENEWSPLNLPNGEN